MSMATANGSKAILYADMRMDEVAAVILVGGRSSRMGTDKASLMRQGQRLVDYVAGVLRQAGISTLFVSGNIEGYSCIPDAVAGHHGPVMGICSSIRFLGTTYQKLIFIPVDMPLLSVEVIQTLLRESTDSWASHFEGNPIPCLLQITNATQEHVGHHLSDTEPSSVKHFLKPLYPHVITPDGILRQALRNTNTPQEWEEMSRESTHQ